MCVPNVYVCSGQRQHSRMAWAKRPGFHACLSHHLSQVTSLDKDEFDNELIILAMLKMLQPSKVHWYNGLLGKLKLNFLKIKLNV